MIKMTHFKSFTVMMALLLILSAASGFFALGLIPFGMNYLKHYKNNLSTNERLRKRWNGFPKNVSKAKVYSGDSGSFTKIQHVLGHDLLPSNFHKMMKIAEIWDQMEDETPYKKESQSKVAPITFE